MKISIFIKKDNETIDADRKFDTYQEAINYLDALENKEMDASHQKNVEENEKFNKGN